MSSWLQTLIRSRLATGIRNSTSLPAELRGRVAEIKSLYDIDIFAAIDVGSSPMVGGPTIDDVLVNDARVCFTGSVIDPAGAAVSKDELETLIVRAGLRWAPTVSKTAVTR